MCATCSFLVHRAICERMEAFEFIIECVGHEAAWPVGWLLLLTNIFRTGCTSKSRAQALPSPLMPPPTLQHVRCTVQGKQRRAAGTSRSFQ